MAICRVASVFTLCTMSNEEELVIKNIETELRRPEFTYKEIKMRIICELKVYITLLPTKS